MIPTPQDYKLYKGDIILYDAQDNVINHINEEELDDFELFLEKEGHLRRWVMMYSYEDTGFYQTIDLDEWFDTTKKDEQLRVMTSYLDHHKKVA